MASSGVIILTIHTIKSFRLRISPTTADNSSQFRAIAIHDFGSEVNHSSVRSDLVAHMRENRSDYVHLMDVKVGDILRRNSSRLSSVNGPPRATQDYVDGMYNNYLTKMAAEEYPGDRITLKALAAYLYTDVLLISGNGCEILRAAEGHNTRNMWAFTYDEETEQWAAVESDGKTIIKELVAGLPSQNFIDNFSQSSTSYLSDSSSISITSGGETPRTTNTTPNTIPQRLEVVSSSSSEKLMTFNDSIYPALPSTTLAYMPLATRAAKESINSATKIIASETRQSIEAFTAWPSIDTIQELNELFGEHHAQPPPPRQYIIPKVQSKNEFVSQKRKRSEEDLCFAKKKKKTSPRTNTSLTPAIEAKVPAHKDANNISAVVKRAATTDNDIGSSPVKKQKADETAVISKAIRTPSGRLIATPKASSKAIPKSSVPLTQPAVSAKTPTNTCTTEPKNPGAAPNAPAPITKKRTTFLFGTKSSIPTITRIYRTERVPDAPQPEPIRITTHEKVGPPAASSKPTTTAKKNVTVPAKILRPKREISTEKPAANANPVHKKQSEKQSPVLQYKIKPNYTRSYEPPVAGPGVVTINTPIPVFDFVPSNETKDEREERLSKLSPLERRKQESKERTHMLAYSTQNRSGRKIFAAAKSVQSRK